MHLARFGFPFAYVDLGVAIALGVILVGQFGDQLLFLVFRPESAHPDGHQLVQAVFFDHLHTRILDRGQDRVFLHPDDQVHAGLVRLGQHPDIRKDAHFIKLFDGLRHLSRVEDSARAQADRGCDQLIGHGLGPFHAYLIYGFACREQAANAEKQHQA